MSNFWWRFLPKSWQPLVEKYFAQPVENPLDFTDDLELERSTRTIRMALMMFLGFGLWAYFGEVDEVSKGMGKIIPSTHEQVIQSLEGGILAELNVAEGEIVEAGQIVAQLDPTRSESSVEESAAKYRASLASAARLQAEVDLTAPEFPAQLKAYPQLIAAETQLYRERRKRLDDSLAGLNDALRLVNKELSITQSLVTTGAASTVEVLRLQRQRSELELKATEMRSIYMVQAREELAKAQTEVQMMEPVIRGREDSLSRLTIHSPVRGIVKNIEVTTIGGVIAANGRLMQIVPLDEHLLVEARISPRDIAFIHPNQSAKVKVTAYDYSIYGGLEGRVTTISPDTIQDKVKPENYYYRVFIRTESDFLMNRAGEKFAITPGMIATVDVKTGRKSILNYLIKPLNKAQEALRER